LLNDTYRTDVHLLYPPHIVALAALYIGFTLSSMTPATRSRSHSTQTNFPLSAAEINAALNVPTPPTIPAEFMASFQVNLPILLACVQEIIILYPVWERFEPVPVKGKQPVDTSGESSKLDISGNPKFGPEDAERLVQVMIDERMEDVMVADGNQLAGKKRQRSAGGA
jgi:cyclin C